MTHEEAKNMFKAAEMLCGASSQLIMAIDAIADANEKRIFRRKFAEIIANIEQDFVFDVCMKYPEFSDEKDDIQTGR